MRARLFALLILVAVSPGGASAAPQVSFPASDSAILTVDKGKGLLLQCSRGVPEQVSDYWVPTEEQVKAFERDLLTYLAERHAKGEQFPFQLAYARQYIGIVVGKERLIYGNYMVVEDFNKAQAANPQVVCDGGPSFWGAAYNLETKKVVHIAFNGNA